MDYVFIELIDRDNPDEHIVVWKRMEDVEPSLMAAAFGGVPVEDGSFTVTQDTEPGTYELLGKILIVKNVSMGAEYKPTKTKMVDGVPVVEAA